MDPETCNEIIQSPDDSRKQLSDQCDQLLPPPSDAGDPLSTNGEISETSSSEPSSSATVDTDNDRVSSNSSAGSAANADVDVEGAGRNLTLSISSATSDITTVTSQFDASMSLSSPLTPCSQFDSCVLEDVGNCCGIAGAALCRMDMIVGRKVVRVWSTSPSRHRWLADPELLGFIAHFTVVSEVLRNPRNEPKFYASPGDGLVLAAFLFDARPHELHGFVSSPDSLMTHSISVVLPYSELNSFLKLKTMCLEWLGRAALELRIRLGKVLFFWPTYSLRVTLDFNACYLCSRR